MAGDESPSFRKFTGNTKRSCLERDLVFYLGFLGGMSVVREFGTHFST